MHVYVCICGCVFELFMVLYGHVVCWSVWWDSSKYAMLSMYVYGDVRCYIAMYCMCADGVVVNRMYVVVLHGNVVSGMFIWYMCTVVGYGVYFDMSVFVM